MYIAFVLQLAINQFGRLLLINQGFTAKFTAEGGYRIFPPTVQSTMLVSIIGACKPGGGFAN